jgi:hypothetical protein
MWIGSGRAHPQTDHDRQPSCCNRFMSIDSIPKPPGPPPGPPLPLLAILDLALWWAVSAWNAVDVEMSIHGYIAMILGIVFSLVIGCGLMA